MNVPMGGNPYGGYVMAWTYFISGVIWIPFSFYMIYCYYEHKRRNQFPQHLILLLLSLCAVTRCIWFFIAPYYGNRFYWEIVNRVATLLQFSAITVLLLMWSRSLKGLSLQSVNSNGELSNMDTTSNAQLTKERNAKQEIVIWRRKVLCILINFVAWFSIIFTIAFSSATKRSANWYEVNAILISALCLLVDAGILYVGVHYWRLIRRELAPVYISPHGSVAGSGTYLDANRLGALFHFIVGYFSTASNQSFRLQSEMLRTIFRVSLVVGVFFAIRAFVVCWLVFYCDYDESGNCFPYLTYPLLFYQFPEFFPSIVIAQGISLRERHLFLRRAPRSTLQKVFASLASVFCCYCVVTPINRITEPMTSSDAGSSTASSAYIVHKSKKATESNVSTMGSTVAGELDAEQIVQSPMVVDDVEKGGASSAVMGRRDSSEQGYSSTHVGRVESTETAPTDRKGSEFGRGGRMSSAARDSSFGGTQPGGFGYQGHGFQRNFTGEIDPWRGNSSTVGLPLRDSDGTPDSDRAEEIVQKYGRSLKDNDSLYDRGSFNLGNIRPPNTVEKASNSRKSALMASAMSAEWRENLDQYY